MASFIIYDVGFLIIFTVAVALFLYSRKKNLKREGIMFLYRTQLGVQIIEKFSDKYKKILYGLRYLIITLGFLLMTMIVYLLGFTLYTYLKFPQITEVIKAPPIMPLIPYFPQLFGVQSLFPPFYFAYFLLALIIVAFVHEFAHGVYMKLFKIKIKSTGFVFLGPILGAFVEQDDKQMNSKKPSEQMTVLAAGVFANLVFALIFFLLLIGLFYTSFEPTGFVFSSYAVSQISSNQINSFGQTFEKEIVYNNQVDVLNLTETFMGNESFFISSVVKNALEDELAEEDVGVLVFDSSPAFNSGLKGAIVQIDGFKINSQESLVQFLDLKRPGDVVEISTKFGEENLKFEVVLGTHPLEKDKAYLGIASLQQNQERIIAKLMTSLMFFKHPSILYEPSWNADVVYFIYNLFWWVAVINLLVALFNMLPLGILDGGRFFYLTILSITKSETFARRSFKLITLAIALLFFLMLFSWFIAL